MAKKYMLDKYIKNQEIVTVTYSTSYEKPPIFQESELHSLVIHNSILQYQNMKLIKENTQLQHKLKQKITCDSMHWEIIEEIKFCEWLHHKQDLEKPAHKKQDLENPAHKFSKKRKSDECDVMSNTHTHTQENKKVKVGVSLVTPPPSHYYKLEEKDKDVVVIYDTDETETDDENYDKKIGIIHFDSDSD